MIIPLDASTVAQSLEIQNHIWLYRQYLSYFQEDASKHDVNYMSEILHAFLNNVIIPYDNIYVVHRGLQESRDTFFNDTLPSWEERISGMSVKVATNNFLWLHQLREGSFVQYLVGYAVKSSKMLKGHRQDAMYLEEVTKRFSEVLMGPLYNALKVHTFGQPSSNVEDLVNA